jgi:hypothetical protein
MLYVQDASGSTAPTVLDMGTSTYVTLTGVSSGTTYQLYVTAWNSQGMESAASNMLLCSDGEVAISLTGSNSTGASVFYRGLNLGGGPVVIFDNAWDGQDAANYSSNANVLPQSNVQLSPAPDPAVASMLTSGLYGSDVSLNLQAVPAGNYLVYVWTFEDNQPLTGSLLVQGSLASSFNTGGAGWWQRLGPFTATVSDGTLQVESRCDTDQVVMSGVELWRLP